MNRVHFIRRQELLFALFIGLVSGVTGCMSARNHPALDAIQGAGGSGGSSTPSRPGEVITEGYIEYPGPQERWAGPASFILRISAKDPNWALINAAPVWFNEPPGDEGATLAGDAVPTGVSSENARERLRYLATAMQLGADPGFKGCLSPVRVRLIREDGTFLEKTGCRAETGWPKVASDMVEFFMTAKLRGSQPAPAESAVPH